MKNQNSYYEMINNLHMPKKQHDALKAHLTEQYEVEHLKNEKPFWKRYGIAAAFAFLLLAGSATAYAAHKYQLFSALFTNHDDSTNLISELEPYVGIDSVTEESEDYQITVLEHMYSKEQNTGLLICSFRFTGNTDARINVANPDHDAKADMTVDLTKDGILPVTGDNAKAAALRFAIAEKDSDDPAFFASHTQMYYIGEDTEDGAYLLGIRYNLDEIENSGKNSKLQMRLIEERGDEVPLETVMQLNLPKTQDMKTTTFTSKELPGSFFVISPIGMTIQIQCEKDSSIDQGFAHEGMILKDMQFVYEDQARTVLDLATDAATLDLADETETSDTWTMTQTFSELVDVDKLLYIDVDGVRFEK